MEIQAATPAEELVTVSVVTYNHEAYVKQCIDAILAQTWKNLEIIVVDDCSTDNTVEVIRRIQDPRIQLITKKVNKGVSDSTDIYLRKATGQYITTMCGDDRMATPDKIQKQVRFLRENRWCSAVFSDINFIDERGESLDVANTPYKALENVIRSGIDNQGSNEFLNTFFTKGNVLAGPTLLADMNIFHQLGSFDRRYLQLQDFDMNIRILLNGFNIAVLADKLVDYRVRDNGMNLSAVNRKSNNRLVYEGAKVLEQYWSLSLEEFKKIFPGYKIPGEGKGELVPYYLQDVLSGSSFPHARLFRANTLDWLYRQSQDMAGFIADNTGFQLTDFYRVTGELNFYPEERKQNVFKALEKKVRKLRKYLQKKIFGV